MTAVSNQVTGCLIRNDVLSTRLLWTNNLVDLVGSRKKGSWSAHLKKKLHVSGLAGFYLFGGVDNDNKLCNDLYLLQFDLEANRRHINYSTGEYNPKLKATCVMTASKVHTNGKGPCPR